MSSHPDVVVAAAYGVPDPQAGDQVMVALVLQAGVPFEPVDFARWIDAEAGIGAKWRPRYVRVAETLPTTGTNKVLTRALAHDKFRLDRIGADALWVRDQGEVSYRPFGTGDEAALSAELEAAGRQRFWDL